MPFESKKIRVLVVDDSAVMRKLIPGLLEQDDEIEVVATAIDGDFAITKVEQLKPDVVTLDVEMPRLNGLTALKHIVAHHPVPVVMLSSYTARGAALTMNALEEGAVDFVCKPKVAAQIKDLAHELIGKVKAAARSKVVSLGDAARLTDKPAMLQGGKKKRSPVAGPACGGKILAIGASSGGPYALRYLLPRIPADFGAGIVIVQHMPESFTSMLARWLDEICEIEVKEAQPGDLVAPGRALIAPGNSHMRIKRRPLGGEAVLERGAPVNGHMPSVDVLFRSVAEEFRSEAMALIMTGMGSDGVEGIGEIKRSGGHTVAQDKESCAIFGMPKVAINKGYIDKVVPLSDMSLYLLGAVGRSQGLEVSRNAERR